MNSSLRQHLLLLIIFFLLCSNSLLYSNAQTYRLKVRIEPESGEIFVQGRLEIHLIDPRLEEFHFNLHGIFQIQELKLKISL